MPYLSPKVKAVKLLSISIDEVRSCGEIVAPLYLELPSSLPQKTKAIFKDITSLSFVAESWHMGILKNINPAKSRTTEFRFETFRHFNQYEIKRDSFKF